MARYPDSPKAYPGTPNSYPVTPKAYPGATAASFPASFDPIMNVPGCVLEIDFETASPVTTEASVANGSDFTNASWTKNETTATGDQDGTADRITVNVAATSAYVSSALTNVQSASLQVPLILTLKAKFVDVQWLVIESRAATAASRTWFDIQNGVVGVNGSSHSAGSITAADGSGYRTISVQVNVNAGTNIFRIYLSTTDGTTITAPVNPASVLLKEAVATQVRLASCSNRVSGVSWANATVLTQFGFEATGLGGKPCIHGFTSQILVSTEAAVVAAFGTDAAFTVFYVVQWDTSMDIINAVFGCGNSGVATSRTRVFGSTTTGAGRHISTIIDDAVATFSAAASADATNQTGAKVVEWFSTGTAISCQDNGAAANPNAAAQDAGTLTIDRVAIGCRPDSAPDSEFRGRIAIVAAWDRVLSTGDRSQIRQYYANKRGIAVTP